MPSTSPKQKRLMQAAAHDPEFAKKAGISMDVAQDFNAADKAAAERGAGKLVKAVKQMRKPLLRIGNRTYGSR